jgi:outer membrane cobalamin receptor
MAAENNKDVSEENPSAIASADTAERKSYGSVHGVVLDKMTKKPLAGVSIIVEGTRRGTTTNQDGAFTISKIVSGKYTLIFEYIGYARKKFDHIMILPNQAVDIQIIEMEEQPILLKEIVVTPGSYSIMGGESTVRQTLTSEDIKIMGWAEDITRAVQRVPGISGNDFSAKFNVRGGDVDEVLVLLDGVQIYKPFHQKDFGGGLFSTVDIETIESLDLLTGGYTAEYGDRMSGVLDLKTKIAKEDKRQTSVGLSLMNLRAFTMGTFNSNKGSWLFSARRGYLDLINRLMKNEFKLLPKYYDLMGKMEYELSNNQTLSAHVFLADDAYKLDEQVIETGKTAPNIDFVDTHYGNHYGWLTLDSFFRPQLYARTLLHGGAVTQKRFRNLFDDDPDAHLNAHTVNDDRKLELFGLKQDWAYEVSKNVLLKLGVDAKTLKAKFTYSKNIRNEFVTANDSLTDQVETLDVQRKENGNQLGFYLSSRFQIFSPLTLETGLRYDYSSYSGDRLWSPRIGVVYSISRATSLRAGGGYYYQSQSIDDLRIEFGENNYHPAELSKHYVLGFEHRFNNGIHVRAEGYLKRISDLQETYVTFANIDEFFPETRDDLIKLIADKATAKGIELYLKHDTGNKFSWWLSYVLSDATDHVTGLQYAGPLVHRTGTLPRFWDQRHTINLDVNYRPNRKWHFNFAWQYRSGWPYTPFEVKRIARGDGTFAYYHDWGLFNSLRYPAYHRLDVRINRHFYPARGKITAFLHVINAYNHENVNNYDFSILEQNADRFRYEINTETWFSILPFVGVSWEF